MPSIAHSNPHAKDNVQACGMSRRSEEGKEEGEGLLEAHLYVCQRKGVNYAAKLWKNHIVIRSEKEAKDVKPSAYNEKADIMLLLNYLVGVIISIGQPS